MWGEHHELPYQSKIKEKFLGTLSLDETAWIGLGVYLSWKLAEILPPLGSHIVYSRLQYFFPLAVCLFLAKGTHPRTGKNIGRYIITILKLSLRRRKYLYRKTNIIEGGDRWQE